MTLYLQSSKLLYDSTDGLCSSCCVECKECGQYTVNFSNVNECSGVSWASDLNSLGNITLTYDYCLGNHVFWYASSDWCIILDCSNGYITLRAMTIYTSEGEGYCGEAFCGTALNDGSSVSNDYVVGDCGDNCECNSPNYDDECSSMDGVCANGCDDGCYIAGYGGSATVSYSTTGCP